MSDFSATYRPCRICRAPALDPFPETWQVEMIKEGPQEGPVRTFITPHRDDCTAPPAIPDPGFTVRMPGRYVTAIRILPPPVPASGWFTVGYTDGGIISSDGLTWERPDGQPVRPTDPPPPPFTFGPGYLWSAPIDDAPDAE